ncbi:MAG: hypothetical protein HYT11_01735 [Candidatus Levybacteria bacterium]|nr:hypothetical protein [Candidatus Levybacteria bacterium]
MKQQQLLLLFIYTFILIIGWIAFNLYNKSATLTITQEQTTQTAPLDPTFNEQIIEELKTRENITPSYQLPAGAVQTPSPTPPSIKAQPATGEALLESSPSAQ